MSHLLLLLDFHEGSCWIHCCRWEQQRLHVETASQLYGGKAASRTFYQYLSQKLIDGVGFTRPNVDECVFYRGSVMYVLYTDCNKINHLAIDLGALKIKLQYKIVRFKVIDL